MTLILNESDWQELHQQAPITCPNNRVLDDFEELTGIPEILGRGYSRGMELSPGVWLNFNDYEYHQDFILKVPDHNHPIQISVLPSGYFDCDIHPRNGGTRSYFSGSGISPGYTESYRLGQRFTCVNVEIAPEVLDSFLMDDRQRQSEQVKQLFKEQDWKVAFYPVVTPAIRSIAQQMWDTPYRGDLKRLYLQAKVMELLVIYLDLISDRSEPPRGSGLKPDTIARLHHAKTILETRLENPPSILDLAQQVGMSDRTLLRGFKQLFGTTVIGYSMQQRLKRAERLLRQGDTAGLQGKCTVTEVARLLGYGNLSYFTTVFKRQFGITPSECLAGKKSVL
jgi:AraC-like DNA-binding protein